LRGETRGCGTGRPLARAALNSGGGSKRNSPENGKRCPSGHGDGRHSISSPRDIVVDVAPLRAWVGDLTAEWVQQELPGALARALPGHFAPEDRNGATLVAQIDYIYLSPTSGGTGKRGAFQDTLEGALILRGPRGGVAAETPLKAIMPYSPMSVDATLVVEGFHGRVVALADAFAEWAPRELGL
jgi:hypothetical protein